VRTPDVELWAGCDTCDRWFFVASAAQVPQDVACPVCAEVPERVEQRRGEEVTAMRVLTEPLA
jgi:hypothetical protein